MKRTPMPPRKTGLRTTTRMTGNRMTASRTGNFPAAETPVSPQIKNAARRKGGSSRSESFPPDVAALLAARDPWCVHCGSPHDLQNHHRRLKGAGGDGRDHTHCACNGVRLCVLCHVPWAHLNRREAEAEGIIVPRSETAPWRRSLMVHTAAGSGFTAFPTCDGGWAFEAPGREAA